MDKLLEYLAKEWAVISQAPFAFLILSALVFGVAYLAAHWRYTSIIEKVKEANETLKERLNLKTEQAEAYKERALKYDDRVLEVVDSSSVSLREKALELVRNIRDFVQRYQREDQTIRENEWFEMTKANTEEEKDRLWNKLSNAMSRLSTEGNAEYDRRFKVDSIILRDELRSRLKDYQPDRHVDNMYEYPTNYIGFIAVACDLEKMAKSLPTANQ
jgi:hypothetical protein